MKHFESKSVYAVGFNNVTFSLALDVVDASFSLPQILYAAIGSLVGLLNREGEQVKRFVGLGLIWSVDLSKSSHGGRRRGINKWSSEKGFILKDESGKLTKCGGNYNQSFISSKHC